MKTALWQTFLSVTCLCWWSGQAAAGKRFELSVEAGRHDRLNVPVRAALELPAELADARAVLLRDEQGNQIPAQLTDPCLLDLPAKDSPRPPAGEGQGVRAAGGRAVGQLHFVLPRLQQGQSLTLTAEVSTDGPKPGGFAWKDTPGQYAELSYASRPVMRYVYLSPEAAKKEGDTIFKVYHHLYDPAGKRLVTKGERTGLFPHHRGLFFGFSRISYGDVKGVNTWGAGGDHCQSHEGFLAEEAGPVLGRHRVAVDWHGQGNQVFAKEQRELTAYHVPGGVLVEFASRLSSAVGKVRLDGDPQHAGFHFRAAQDVADNAKATYYLRPDGKDQPGKTRNWDHKTRDPRCVNLPWNAVSFLIDQRRYTVVYLDHPANPKEARYSERDYGRFGSYFEYELDDGKDLVVRYRIWLQEGEMSVEQAAALSADFVEPPLVRVK